MQEFRNCPKHGFFEGISRPSNGATPVQCLRPSISSSRRSISNSYRSISNSYRSISNSCRSISNSCRSISNSCQSISNSRQSISNSCRSISSSRRSISSSRRSISNSRQSISGLIVRSSAKKRKKNHKIKPRISTNKHETNRFIFVLFGVFRGSLSVCVYRQRYLFPAVRCIRM